MNAFFLLTALAVSGNFNADDFHYMKDQKVVALPVINKLYFETMQSNADDLYEKFKPKNIEKKFRGLVLTFDGKEDTLNALNLCLKDKDYKDQVHPVVMRDKIETAVLNYLVVELHPTVKKKDYITRLNSVADANFESVDVAIGPLPKKPFTVISVKNLTNPPNILALAELVARDTFWVKSAAPRFLPLDKYVNASLSIETSSKTDLGHNRVARLRIDVYDPQIVVRTDLLPVTLKPFPYNGDSWFDAGAYKIIENSDGDKKTITIEYPFKYLHFGVFAFDPIRVSYEQRGELLETATSYCEFHTSSVIEDTDIDDVQSVIDNFKMDTTTNLKAAVTFNKVNNYMGLSVLFAFIGCFGMVFIATAIIPWLTTERKVKEISVWDEMYKAATPKNLHWQEWYTDAANAVDNVLIEEFGISLHSLTPEDCNNNFKMLLAEFNNLYIPDEKHDVGNLNAYILKFYKDRRYD